MRNSLNSSPLCEVSVAHTCANTFFKKYHSHLKWVLKGFHSEIILSSIDKFLYLLTRTLHSYKSESSFIFLSKKYIPLYKDTVQNGATLCKECHIIWKVPLHKGIYIYTYEDVALKTNFKDDAATCLFLLFQVWAVLCFFPWSYSK